MISIVIAYEDAYYEGLHALVKRLRKGSGKPSQTIIEPFPIEGTGNFAREVPHILRMPLKQTKRPPDRVVCVGDADRPGNLVPGAARAPISEDLAALDAWVIEFETAWRTHLVTGGSLSDDDAARLRTICLRWNKESILLASPQALCEYARKYDREDVVLSRLAQCDPEPFGLADEAFLVAYRDSVKCMDKIVRLIHSRKYKKGLHDEDILKQYILAANAKDRLDDVLRRSPDLARLLNELL